MRSQRILAVHVQQPRDHVEVNLGSEGEDDAMNLSELSEGECLPAERRIRMAHGWRLAALLPMTVTLALLSGACLVAGTVVWRPAQLEGALGRNEVYDDVTQEAHPPDCQAGQLPEIWGPNTDGPAMEINVMTYNLFWWQLFDKAQGPVGHLQIHGNMATQLITKALKATPFDVIGFQECEDEQWLVNHAGMAAEYAIFRDRACCMAYRTRVWKLLARGVNYVADDVRYGMRPAQWMRLQHLETKKILFFVNHHGPLPISSGGICGGRAHAFNLLKVLKSHAQPGDVVVLVADMNADPASICMKLLASRLHVVYGGWKAKTHIDFILSNVAPSTVVRAVDLGSGGSDHNALHATLRVGSGGAAPTEPPVVEAFKTQGQHQGGKRHKPGLCSKEREGRFEYGITYVVAKGSGRLHFPGLGDEEACCLKCHSMPRCKSFTYHSGDICWLFGALPTVKRPERGTVSGLPMRGEEAEEVYEDEVEESQEVQREEEETPTEAEAKDAGAEERQREGRAPSENAPAQAEKPPAPAPAEPLPPLQVSLPDAGPPTPAPPLAPRPSTP